MNSALTYQSSMASEPVVRYAAQGSEPSVFTDIYQEKTNITIWKRKLSETLHASVGCFLRMNPTFQTAITVTPQNVHANLGKVLGNNDQLELIENIVELVDMFCCLFELKHTGLRLTVLDRAMCPRFHVDKVPCRLVTTYHGVATEWLPHQAVNREKLGAGSCGQSDSQSGLFKNQHDIQQLNCGDVALLKGELWEGNKSAGLVHRSPAVLTRGRRMLLTLDVGH